MAAQRAEASARALAVKLNGLHPDLDEIIEIVVQKAVWHAERVEKDVVDLMMRRHREAVLDAMEERFFSAIEMAVRLPPEQRVAFLQAEVREAGERTGGEASADFEHYVARRQRGAWEWANEELTEFVHLLDRPVVAGFKSADRQSSFGAMQRLRSIEASLAEPMGTHADALIIMLPIEPAAWIREKIAEYERKAPAGESFDRITGLGVGRRWYTVEKEQRHRATVLALSETCKRIVFDAEYRELCRRDSTVKKYSKRHLRRIVVRCIS